MMVRSEKKQKKKVGGKVINPQAGMSSLYIVMTGGAGFLLNSLNLFAASSSAPINVNASVAPSCKFINAAGTLFFGTYDDKDTSPLDATGFTQLKCTKSTNVVLSINNGLNAVGPQRRMTDNNNNFLNYQVYTTAARSTIWNTTNTVSVVTTSTAPQTINLYGRMPPGQSGNTGGYVDTLVITATF